MASDLQFNVDEVEASLDEILPAVEAGTAGILDAHSPLAELLTQFKQHSSELRGVLETLHNDGQARLVDVRNSHIQSEEMSRWLDESFASATDHTQEIGDALQQLSDQIQSSMSELSAHCVETTNAFTERAAELINLVSEIQESVTEQASGLMETVEAWSGAINDSQSHIEEKAAAFQESLAAHAENVSGQLVADSQAGCDAFRSIIDSHVLQEMQESFSGIGEDIVQLSDDAKGAIEGLAEDLRTQLSECMTGLQTYAENQVESEIKASFDNLVDTCLAEFVAELIESVALTQVGVSTTTVLSPIIPELIVAEKLLGTVKNIFD